MKLFLLSIFVLLGCKTEEKVVTAPEDRFHSVIDYFEKKVGNINTKYNLDLFSIEDLKIAPSVRSGYWPIQEDKNQTLIMSYFKIDKKTQLIIWFVIDEQIAGLSSFSVKKFFDLNNIIKVYIEVYDPLQHRSQYKITISENTKL